MTREIIRQRGAKTRWRTSTTARNAYNARASPGWNQATQIGGSSAESVTLERQSIPPVGKVKMSEPRSFNTSQRVNLYLKADGKCRSCGVDLEPGWHADHVIPHSAGGRTSVENGQALCPTCNMSKGAKMPTSVQLRKWQIDHNESYRIAERASRRDWLTNANPGAGKTLCISALAMQLLQEGRIDRVTVVVPTLGLKEQWATAAARVGLQLQPIENGDGRESRDFHGCVVTYGQVTVAAQHHANLTTKFGRTLVVLDEIHHAGDFADWGKKLRLAFGQAHRRILLTGTPFRSDNQAIPFAPYDPDTGILKPDYSYGYGSAVRDGVNRPVTIEAYDGTARWRDLDSETQVELVDMKETDTPQALRTILDSNLTWLPEIIRIANQRLLGMRTNPDEPIHDAAGLIIAMDQTHARAIKDMMRARLGIDAELILSEDADSVRRLRAFTDSKQSWVIAVRMISEGIDIPRLRVCVYATNYRTELFFRQAIGRIIRVTGDDAVGAVMFIPALRSLKEFGKRVEDEVRHAIDLDDVIDGGCGGGGGNGDEPRPPLFEPIRLQAHNALLDEALYRGEQFTADEIRVAETAVEAFGIPKAYVMQMVRYNRSLAVTPTIPSAARPAHVEETHVLHRNLRATINELVRRSARLTMPFGDNGKVHAGLNTRVNQMLEVKSGQRKQASIDQLREVISWLESQIAKQIEMQAAT